MTRESGKRTRLRFGAVSAEVSLVKATTKPREAQHETRRVLVEQTTAEGELAGERRDELSAAEATTDPFGDPAPAPSAPVVEHPTAPAGIPPGLLGPMGDPSWPNPSDDLAEQAAEAPPPARPDTPPTDVDRLHALADGTDPDVAQRAAADLATLPPAPEPGDFTTEEREGLNPAAPTYVPPATRVEQGVHLEDGTWVDLTAKLAEVDERTKVDGLEVVRTIPASSYASERVRELHYLAGVEPQTYKVLALLWRALRKTGRAAEVRWTKRTVQAHGIILARGEFGSKSNPAHLALLELEWAQNIRRPSGRVTGPITAAATREEVDAAVELVESFHAPAPREELRDERLAKRAELLTLARAGELEAYAPPAEPMPEDLGAEVDVAEALALAAAWNREHAPA